MSNEIIEISKLVPEKLREKPLFDKVIKLLDYVIEQYYQDNYEAVKHAYDIFFDPEIIYRVLADEELKELFLSDETASYEIIWLLNLMQRLRGTKKGMDFFLRLLNLANSIIKDRKDDDTIDPCKVRVELSIDDVLNLEYLSISKILKIFAVFLHICVELDTIALIMNFESTITVRAFGSPMSGVLHKLPVFNSNILLTPVLGFSMEV